MIKTKNLHIYFLLGIVLVLFFGACKTKIVPALPNDLVVANKKLLELSQKLETKSQDKMQSGVIDSSVYNAFNDKIEEIKNNAKKRDTSMQTYVQGDLAKYYQISPKGYMQSLEIEKNKWSAAILKDAKTLDLINQNLDLSDMFKYPKVAYFKAAKYQIPTSVWMEAKQVYEPIADSIIKFANRFSEEKFICKIAVFGYTDDQFTNPQSEIFKEIKNTLQVEELTEFQFHAYLSYLRANEILQLIKNIFRDKEQLFLNKENVQILFFKEGKGTELPENVEPYEYEKRRAARVYWSMLPK